MRVGRRIEAHGIVQGVGFRPWVSRLARETGVAGRVRNDAAGITIEAYGEAQTLDVFLQRLRATTPPAADVREWRATAIPDNRTDAFEIAPSLDGQERRISIPADQPTCPACLSEISDPANRRYRYAFTNCTDCGPRFTIARDAPYDRDATTMAVFRMCPACQREYDDVDDRRFHAQPNACPACGPGLVLMTADGDVSEDPDPIAAAARALAAGGIVAVKGIGGFHLACDATNRTAVQELRARKRRDEKPFALMVPDPAAAERVALLTDDDRALLTAIERPIVLVPRRPDCDLAGEIAPRNPLVGLMLPYTPLHHLLLHDVDRPIVMTSGNISDEPLAYRNEDALERLAGIADLFLIHDRGIDTRCDDSVARVIAGQPVVLRRSRGYVPRAIAVSPSFAGPVLACGALLKNTFCIGVGDSAILGPHIGDLENLETYGSFEESIARLTRFLRVTPEIVAYDLHPDYLSTRYALAMAEARHIGVQHHHAHIASVMAEHLLTGPVIGVAYDGTGYGTDGTAWGGEVMVARYEGFQRVATTRPVALAGGDAAIRHPWRIALALLEDAFGGRAPLDVFTVFNSRPRREVAAVREMIAHRIQAPLAHGVGRYFDGVGALALARSESRHEGQIALEWNLAADPSDAGRYGFAIDCTTEPWTLDLRPLILDVAHAVRAKVSASVISARFHNTLAAATIAMVRSVAKAHGVMPVVLSGGCFQNARLAESVVCGLSSSFDVHLNRRVPPGDGGLALGQAVIAGAIARRLRA